MTHFSWLLGGNPPRGFYGDIRAINRISSASFQTALQRLDNWVFGKEAVTSISASQVGELSKSAQLDRTTATSLVRLYTNLASSFMSAPSRATFVSGLADSGLNPEKAELFAKSFETNLESLRADLKQETSEWFGPVLSRTAWRVDSPVAGSRPFYSEPVGVLSLQLETPTDTVHQRIELRLEILDALLEELSAMRRELGRLSAEATRKGRAPKRSGVGRE